MHFHRKPPKLPVVLSVEEVADLLAAVPGPGLKYRVALGISNGAEMRASEVCHLKVPAPTQFADAASGHECIGQAKLFIKTITGRGCSP